MIVVLYRIYLFRFTHVFTCLLRNLYAGQEAVVKTGHRTMDWLQIGKGVCENCVLSPCLFNFYVEYIMRNAKLEEAQAGIKIAWRKINNLRYADDTTANLKTSAPWKKSYHKPRQHIKRQRHYFADKNQSYGFSSSRVWM